MQTKHAPLLAQRDELAELLEHALLRFGPHSYCTDACWIHRARALVAEIKKKNDPPSFFEIGLHTNEPDPLSPEASEARYVGYVRGKIPRTMEWVRARASARGTTTLLAQDYFFPACVGGKEILTHYSIWLDGTMVSWTGLLDPLHVSCTHQPGIKAGAVLLP